MAQTSNSQSAAGRADAEGAWDAGRLTKAVESLDEMYKELHEMRTAIPRLLAPMTAEHRSPQDFYNVFYKAMKESYADLERFRDLMTKPEAKTILARATESAKQNPADIHPWSITDHPYWLSTEASES